MELGTAFRRLFAGLLIVLIDIRIGNLDIIPDALGFFLTALALNRLAQHSRYFSKARTMAILLVVLSSLSFVLFPEGEPMRNLEFSGNIGVWVYSLGLGVLRILMAYFIFEGIQGLLAPINPALESATANRKWFYVGFNYLWLLILPFGLNVAPHIISPFLMFFGFIVFILEILFVAHVHRVGKEII